MDKNTLIQALTELKDQQSKSLLRLENLLQEVHSSTIVQGEALSTGYYVNGNLDSSYTNKTPQQAKDDGLWYSFINGQPELAHYYAHTSDYSNYAFWNGSINTSGYNPTPGQAWDNGKWYVYNSGVAVPADGAYSNGAYVAGELDVEGVFDGDRIATDDGQTRSYSKGVVVG